MLGLPANDAFVCENISFEETTSCRTSSINVKKTHHFRERQGERGFDTKLAKSAKKHGSKYVQPDGKVRHVHNGFRLVTSPDGEVAVTGMFESDAAKEQYGQQRQQEQQQEQQKQQRRQQRRQKKQSASLAAMFEPDAAPSPPPLPTATESAATDAPVAASPAAAAAASDAFAASLTLPSPPSRIYLCVCMYAPHATHRGSR